MIKDFFKKEEDLEKFLRANPGLTFGIFALIQWMHERGLKAYIKIDSDNDFSIPCSDLDYNLLRTEVRFMSKKYQNVNLGIRKDDKKIFFNTGV